MKLLFLILPLILPIFGGLALSSKRIVKDKDMKIVTGFIVFFNFIFIIIANINSSFETIHLLRVNEFLDIYFHIDQLGKLFSYMAGFLWILTAFYSFEYMKHEGKERQFYTFFITTLGVIVGISYSANLFTLYIYYELLTLVTFPMVIHAGTEEALQSGKKYIIYSFTGATFIILGMMILFSISGNMTFTGGGIATLINYGNKDLILISFISMFIGFGVKAAIVPLHSWLPAAMVAPTPVSALLHAVAVVKSGIFSLIRVTYYIYGPILISELNGDKYLIPFVILTIVMGSFMALHQDHLKKRLAYSTIAQLGYIILGILMLNPDGLMGGILHMINHAFIKITLFFSVGAITYVTGNKYIHQISGLGKKMPKVFLAFTVSAISLVGIPPTNGFVSKWFLGMGALSAHNHFYIIILLLSAFLTAAYLLPVSISGFFTKSNENKLCSEEITDPPVNMMAPIIILTIVVIFLGIFPNGVINFISHIVDDVF